MTVRVAFLRGINVGKAHRVPMAELRALATGLGLTDVATHLQSGNLLHSSEADPEADRLRLAAALEEAFGFTVDVVVVEADRLADLVAAHPSPTATPSGCTWASHPVRCHTACATSSRRSPGRENASSHVTTCSSRTSVRACTTPGRAMPWPGWSGPVS